MNPHFLQSTSVPSLLISFLLANRWKRGNLRDRRVFLVCQYFSTFTMPTQKVEKIPLNSLVGETMDVIREMLMLIAERTQCENNNMGI